MVSAVSGLLAARSCGWEDQRPELERRPHPPPGALAEEASWRAASSAASACASADECHPPGGLGGRGRRAVDPQIEFPVGTSGCQHTCIACGHLCPTAAIRPSAWMSV